MSKSNRLSARVAASAYSGLIPQRMAKARCRQLAAPSYRSYRRKAGNDRRALPDGGLGIGGTERHLSLVLPELARRGWRLELALLTSDGPFGDPLKAAAISVTQIDNPRLIPIPKLRGLQSLRGRLRRLATGFTRLRLAYCIVSCRPRALSEVGRHVPRNLDRSP